MSKLPLGWIITTIGDIAESISRGKSPRYADNSALPIVNQRAIRWDGLQNEYLKYVNPDQISEWPDDKYIQEGDILWNSTGTGTIGRACLIKQEDLQPAKVVDSHVTIVRPIRHAIDSRYLLAWLRGPQVQQAIDDLATGTTNQIELSRAMATGMSIPLPPLLEQGRIANKLDELLRQIDSSRQRIERTKDSVERFRKSVLLAATSGKLTESWRSNEDLPWEKEFAKDVCQKVQSGGTPKEGFIETDGVPFLKIYNIVNQKVDFHKKIQFISSKVNDGSMSKSITLPGDVLMNIVGPPLGKVAIVPEDYPQWNINQAITLFRPSDRIITGWLYYVLCAGENIASIVHETRGSAGQVNISLSQCRDFIFPVPSLAEQQEIVRRVDILLKYADSVESKCNGASVQIDQMVPTLLEKAFRGELVKQDRNDEPAALMLGRVKVAQLAKSLEPKPITIKTKSKMAKLSNESLKKVIDEMPDDNFTFNELTRHLFSDYESIKEVLFSILTEVEPSIRQVFDETTGVIHFKKEK